MKKLLLLLSAALVSASLAAAPPSRTQLYRGWKVQSSAKTTTDGSRLGDTSGWYDATVPSTTMGVLMDNGALPADLLDGFNYKNVDRTQFDAPWWWTTSFDLPKLDRNNRVTLDLDGISYRADVWVNGKLVAPADSVYGTFRRHSLDITPYVKKNNTVALLVHKAKGGEPNIGFVDWNPRPADESMGVFRPVWVHVTDGVAISKPVVKTRVNTETLKEADLFVEAYLTNTTARPVTGTFRGTFEGGKFAKTVTLEPGATTTVYVSPVDSPDLHVDNPRLWWPNGMGSPEMYSMSMEFVPEGKEAPADRAEVSFGIRSIKDYYTKEDNQRAFKVNGKPVLVRSAGWTDDIFLRNDSVRNEIEARYVKDMGLNSIRFENIWGTSENIYDLCDRLGLMALVGWSCQWEWENYLGSPVDQFGGIITEHDQQLIARSFGDQVAWLRNHPSIIAWFTGSDMLPRPSLEQRYLDILETLDSRPYIGAAKQKKSELTGFTGTKMAGPYEYVAPNYWYDPKAPGGAFGFNTETGIGAQVPQKESAMRMMGEGVWPIGDAWDYHCTTSGDGMHDLKVLKNVIDTRYGAPTDLDDFMHKAEWINYDGTRTMFEAFRARVPRATGIVQWMLNSAWPSVYWQLYDHYLVPTSAYYSLRHSNAPVQLIYDYGKREVVAVNESGKPAALKARMELFGLADAEGRTSEATVEVAPFAPVKVFDLPDPEAMEFVFLTLTGGSGATVAENFYVLAPTQDVNDFEHGNWFVTPVSQPADFKPLADMPRADVATDVTRSGDTVTVKVTNRSANVAFFNRLTALDADGQLYAPAWWSDNYFSLRPGETRTVTCRLPSTADAQKARITLDGWNLKK